MAVPIPAVLTDHYYYSDGSLHVRKVKKGRKVQKIAVLPRRCRTDEHDLTETGYRAVVVHAQIYVICLACPADAMYWALQRWTYSPVLAELDDEPYKYLRTKLITKPRPPIEMVSS